MPTKLELDRCYLQCAKAHAMLSKAERKKVGACLVTPAGVVIPGYNGTPRGADNCCERIALDYTPGGVIEYLETKPDVIHAELNCVLKAAEQGVSVKGSTLYVTLSPCLACSAFLKQVGVKEVVYLEQYRCTQGIDYLKRHGVQTFKYQESNI